ncbi:hypothetical protein [Agaribacterium haliotis]|uniref:hypothetical protein n=1 Tax=Agaribacterium haliotis TaxID=2013869 RepID=UPI000BB57ACD|nr:hypothetical protein [Agaribacterium haliotis]
MIKSAGPLWPALIASVLCLVLAACGSSGGSGVAPASSPSPSIQNSPRPEPSRSPSADDVFVSGSLSYDFVPQAANGALDYGNIASLPMRAVTVQLLDENNQALDEVSSDELGNYELRAPRATDVRVRVLAEIKRDQQPSWNFQVSDNTNNNNLYAVQGSLISSGDSNSQRDLHAASGWTGQAYGGPRSAAPFAILDSVYELVVALSDAGLDSDMLPLELRWSPDNKALDGDVADGNIGTSHYDVRQQAIYLLGWADNDSDEYDRSVVQHEFFHFVEATLSRSESIGGSHSQNDKLDMRVAFSEGTANAIPAFLRGDGFFGDSAGSQQQGGFAFNIEQRHPNLGWFSESSVASLVYDVLDDNSEQGDAVALGLPNFLRAYTGQQFRSSDALSSIYLFLASLQGEISSAEAAELEQLANSYEIYGSGPWGEAETNSGGSSIALPIYHQLELGASINLCSRANDGNYYNYFEVRRFVQIEVPHRANYEFTASLNGVGTGDRDPDMVLFRQGAYIAFMDSTNSGTEQETLNLEAGTYVLELYDAVNTKEDGDLAAACFDLSWREV